MQLVNSILANPIGQHFGIHRLNTNLVELVYCHSDIDDFVGLPDIFSYAGKYFSIVQLYLNVDAELGEYRVHDLHQFHFVKQRVRPNHVGIALIELSIPTLLWAVGSPHGLNLVTLERHLQFIAMHYHIASKRNCEVVAQSLLANLGCQFQYIVAYELLSRHFANEIARIKDFEQ